MSDAWLERWLAHCEHEWMALQVARNLSEHFCAQCGLELEFDADELHCKKICLACGAKRDCSDP